MEIPRVVVEVVNSDLNEGVCLRARWHYVGEDTFFANVALEGLGRGKFGDLISDSGFRKRPVKGFIPGSKGWKLMGWDEWGHPVYRRQDGTTVAAWVTALWGNRSNSPVEMRFQDGAVPVPLRWHLEQALDRLSTNWSRCPFEASRDLAAFK